MKRAAVPIARARELLEYDPLTGAFRWKVTLSNRAPRGSEAARRVNADGYRRVSFDGRTYLAHVVAWALFYGVSPPLDVDHINMVCSDNRIVNLRSALRSQNMANCGLRCTSTSGFKGVTWHTGARKWMAGIKVNYRRIHLGLFESAEAAYAAYLEAAEYHFGDFARTI